MTANLTQGGDETEKILDVRLEQSQCSCIYAIFKPIFSCPTKLPDEFLNLISLSFKTFFFLLFYYQFYSLLITADNSRFSEKIKTNLNHVEKTKNIISCSSTKVVRQSKHKIL